ncbi:50S ribosomal protein L24 [Candidatus Woesearchaeota archaeon]|nr:50S ribosomal protein L24 [Candidatus Woesearchaeota archaeon]|tara:strand:+ start:15038 stop:15409 length:372 start_codon:yes stop_codon:yes gene_type:complete
MKTQFSKTWNRSLQPRKQRKYRYNLPIHLKNKLLSTHLSAELRTQYGMRNIPVKKNDMVKVLKGSFRGKTGKVNSVSTKKLAAYIDGVESSRRDGTKVFVPIKVSNLMIIELNTEDKRRIKNE